MKIKYNTKNTFFFVIVAFLLIFLSSFISALTVAVPSDLSLYPGQVFDSGFDIMNTIQGSSDVVLEAQFSEGSEIVSFTRGNRFNVPRESSIPAYVRFRIPADAVVGTAYPVKVVFKTVSVGQGSGSVNFVEDVVKSFNVHIVEKSAIVTEQAAQTGGEKISLWTNAWFWIIIIIIIIIILWLVFKAKKQKAAK